MVLPQLVSAWSFSKLLTGVLRKMRSQAALFMDFCISASGTAPAAISSHKASPDVNS